MEAARDLALEAARVRSEFLTSMSHEVRTPLNAIIGLTELLMLSDLSPAQHQQMDQIRSSGELLLTIDKDILDFSKLAAGKVVLETAVKGKMAVLQWCCESCDKEWPVSPDEEQIDRRNGPGDRRARRRNDRRKP